MTPQAQQLLARIEHDLARDQRNQKTIDAMKRLSRPQRALVQLRKHPFEYTVVAMAFVLIGMVTCAHADPLPASDSVVSITNGAALATNTPPPKPECPSVGEKCKVIFLSEAEERLITGQNGILDTAAQARALDLGQFAVYLKTRIAGAAAGEVKPLPAPTPAQAAPMPPTIPAPTEQSVHVDTAKP